MKAMLWKELRENLRWAVLGCVLLTLAEFYILAGARREFQNGTGSNILTDDTFLMVVLFGSALLAGGLAALQILPERSRDRWAALLHRPVSSSVIFGAKAVAGLGLYAAAVLLPFLASAGYVAWPGNFPAPFVPGLLLPGLYALTGGASFYFGTLLLCLHRGRWLGTRGFLLLALGAVFLLQTAAATSLPSFPVVAAVILALAAWHTLLGEHPAGRWGWLRKASFVAVVLLGAQSALMLVGIGLSLLPPAQPAQRSTYTRLEVTQAGRFLRLRSSLTGEGREVTDLAGHVITDPAYVGKNSYQDFCHFWPLAYGLNLRRNGTYPYVEGAFAGTSHVQGVRLGSEARVSWYLLVHENYFVGYDNLSYRCVGICDREGFKAPGAKPVPFPHALHSSFYFSTANHWYWSDHRLYSINFFDRQLKPFFDRPNRVIYEVLEQPYGRASENVRYLVLALADEIQVLDDQGRPVFKRPYLHDPQRWDTVQVATNQAVDRFYFQSQNGFYNSAASRPPDLTYLDEVDLHGNVSHSYGEVIDNTVAADPRWLTTAQVCLLPSLPALLLRFHHATDYSPLIQAIFPLEHVVRSMDNATVFCVFLLTVAWAATALVLARQIGFTVWRAWGWAVFVLIFGPAGLLAFRWAADWPARLRCPSCGRLRSLHRERCAHCQQPWAPPPPSGTEIFQLATR